MDTIPEVSFKGDELFRREIYSNTEGEKRELRGMSESSNSNELLEKCHVYGKFRLAGISLRRINRSKL